MEFRKNLLVSVISCSVVFAGCSGLNRMQGNAIGTSGGGVIGTMIGKAYGNQDVGTAIGETVGGVTGSVVSSNMDRQASELKKEMPGIKVERVDDGILVEFNNKILFTADQSDLSDSAAKSLNELVKVIQKYPDTNIEILGHTDDKGSSSYNQDLSQRRAIAVSDYLKTRGISDNRIIARGLGEDSPKYTNDTEAGRNENRRVELLISSNEKIKEVTQKENK